MSNKYKCCFATVITKPEYEVTAGRLYQAFKYLGSEFTFEIIITNNLNDSNLPFLVKNNIPFRKVELLQFNKNKNNIFWQDTASKFNILTLTEYDYVCFIDADTAIDTLLDSILYDNIPFDNQFKVFQYSDHFPDGCLFFAKPSLEEFNKIKSYIIQSEYFTDEQIIYYYYYNECIQYIDKLDWDNLIKHLLHFNSPFKIYNFDVGNILKIFREDSIEVYLNRINELYNIQLQLNKIFIDMLKI